MDEDTNIAKNTILETLSFSPAPTNSSGNCENSLLSCMFCDHTENQDFRNENKVILQHIYMQHRIVIADVQDINELKEYLEFWKNEFKG